MANTALIIATKRVSIGAMRKTALVAGVLDLLTFVSIPRLALFGPILNNPDYILRPGGDPGVLVGVVVELILALAIVGTGVALFPVLKRQNESVAVPILHRRCPLYARWRAARPRPETTEGSHSTIPTYTHAARPLDGGSRPV